MLNNRPDGYQSGGSGSINWYTTPHTGLNRENVESLLNGDVFTFPPGMLSGLSEESDVVLLFAETDQELDKRFPPSLRPV
ncbi:MAG: hypothetical protein JO108_07355 [Acidobacteriaceae bacterium]|nr:hypothetical protein [Acidobacteriaceae bacterium]